MTNYRANFQLSNEAGDIIAEPGDIIAREAIPSNDKNVALLVKQGILEKTADPVTRDAPVSEPQSQVEEGADGVH